MTNPPILYDTAIVGGGLAGLSLAILLSRKGYRVLLLEKETYPFHKVCGEYISMESWDFLLKLGLPLNEWNLPRISQVTISAPDGYSITETLPLGGFGISRFKLDAAMARIAKNSGTTVLENTKVTDISYKRDLFNISTSAGLFRARTACAGYGKRSNLDVKWKRPFTNAAGSKNYVGVKYHVRAAFPENQIALHNFRGGYCGISKIEDNRYCLCYLTLSRNLKKSGQSIKEMENGILKRNPKLREVFDSIEHLYEDPLTISQISFAKKTQVENHVLCVGDAAGMITPLCGNGMSMALHGSKIAADCLDKFLGHSCERSQLETTYQREWKRNFAARLNTGRILQRFFGNPFWSALLIRLLKPFPGLLRRLIRKTHGAGF
ncbi:MAG: NAD(P)/FAD-dependent oxidoreductase [Bacteroidota bacterium]|nr:NAD(P)/FAD-dependent oxidoreductase [Bacteroidota bacterium]